MATRFEFVLQGDDPVTLRAAGEEALAEIERLEAQLSLFVPTSEIAHVNARAAKGPVRVSAEVLALLQRAARLHQETDGVFDITIAPLLGCWGFLAALAPAGQGQPAEARECVGMDKVISTRQGGLSLSSRRDDARFGSHGERICIERAVEILREAGIQARCVHGGTSTVYGLGEPLEGGPWKIGLRAPPCLSAAPPLEMPVIRLRNEALSVSARWGKSFEAGGQTYGHVLDPRTGRPVAHGPVLAAIIAPSATDTDALSTALLVLGHSDFQPVAARRPGLRTVLVTEASQGRFIVTGSGQEAFPAC
jgi:thiamine biosynthesis lipoprotein